MTANPNRKRLVRQRMARTGESYAAALRHLQDRSKQMTLEHPIVKTPLFQRIELAVTSMVRKILPDQPVLRVVGPWEGDNPIQAALQEVSLAVEHQALNLAGPPYWIIESAEGDDQTTPKYWEAGLPVQHLGADAGRVRAAVLPAVG